MRYTNRRILYKVHTTKCWTVGRNTTGPPRAALGELRCAVECYRRQDDRRRQTHGEENNTGFLHYVTLCRRASNNLVRALEHTGCAAMYLFTESPVNSSFLAISSTTFFFSISLLYDFEVTWYKDGFSVHNSINDASRSSYSAMFSFSCHKWRHMISSQKKLGHDWRSFSSVQLSRIGTLLQPDSTQLEMFRNVEN